MVKVELYGSKNCGTCKMSKQALERVKDDFVEIEVFDVNDTPKLFEELKINKIPTFRFYDSDGNLRAVINRGMAESQIRKKIIIIQQDCIEEKEGG